MITYFSAGTTDLGIWTSVYKGSRLFFQDIDLPMFTTYVYRITVFNGVSQSISGSSDEVTTFGGLPRLPPVISVSAVDHMSIRVNWTLPGNFKNFDLIIQSCVIHDKKH